MGFLAGTRTIREYTFDDRHNPGRSLGFSRGRTRAAGSAAYPRRPRFGSAVSETSMVEGSKPSRASSSRMRARWSPCR